MKAVYAIVALIASSLLPSVDAVADQYPTKLLRVVTSHGPGGLSDIYMRALAEGMGPILGQTVIVENRVGAEGTIGARACAAAPPDGYTFCILPDTALVYNPLIMPEQQFNPKERLVPITRLFNLTQVLAVPATINVKSLDELIKYTKANPKTVSYMTPSLAKVAFMNDLNSRFGTDFVRVPFRGGADAVNAMLSNTIQAAAFGFGNLAALIEAGKIVGLGIDGEKRLPLAPNVPTFKELGYPDEGAPFFGLFAPMGTPRPIIERLFEVTRKVESDPKFDRVLHGRGMVSVINTPDEFSKDLENERAIALSIIRRSGVYPHIK
jgi:tripartite-type tricarboxylate transporter receptor subunit TctC